jgi:Mrp family chromosome partitioning ATPase
MRGSSCAVQRAEPSPQVKRVLERSDPLQDGLVPVESAGVEMRVLAVRERLDPGLPIRMPRGREMIAELLRDTDVLVIDAPRLTDSVPALLLARSADRVVLVARIGETRLDELRELGELFANHGVRVAGIVLAGVPAGRRAGLRARPWRRPLAPNALPATGSGSRRTEGARPTPPAPFR